MTAMSTPLPLVVGPFRVSARLAEPPAGVVFLAEAPSGDLVSVAVLNRGAASDAAAVARFRAAIAAGSASGAVAAAGAEGDAPWVAVAYEPGGESAGRFLEPVWLAGGVPGGPAFVPYWAGSRDPALPGVAGAGPAVPRGRWVAGLAGLAVVLGVLLGALFGCGPSVPAPTPPAPPEAPSSRPSQVPSPSPADPVTPGPSGTPGSGAAGSA